MELRERCKGLIGFKSNETFNFWQELLRILYFIDLIGSTNLIKVSISNFKKLVIKTFKNPIFLLFLQIAHVFTFDRDKKKIKNSQKNRRSPCLYNLTKRDSLSLYSNILAFPPIINRDHQFSHNISSPLQLSACPTILPLSKEKKRGKKKETEWGPSLQLRRYSKIYLQEVEARFYSNRNSDSKVCNKRRRRVNENGRRWRKRLSKLAAEIHYEGGEGRDGERMRFIRGDNN